MAVVLAAGRGTRMGALTDDTPKPLLRLQGHPILEHILLGLRDAGITEVILIVGYRGDQIEARFGSGSSLGLKLRYERQIQQDGTARALLLSETAMGGRPFVLSWGDILIEPHEYIDLIETFHRTKPDALLSLNPVDDPWRGAAVYVDEQFHVTQLIEKPRRGTSATHWNNAGIFVFQPLVFSYAKELTPSERGEYELPQAITAMIAEGRDVRGFPLHGFWSDLGTPEDLSTAEEKYRGRPHMP